MYAWIQLFPMCISKKITDSSVSLQAILGEVAGKIGESPTELILLDSKFIEIGDDSRGKFVRTI